MACLKITALAITLAIVSLFGLGTVGAQAPKSVDDLTVEYLELPGEPSADTVLRKADRYAYEIQLLKERNRLFQIVGTFTAGLVSLAMVLFVITRSKEYTAQHLINASGLVLVIFGTLLIVILADVQEQLTASIGIMGAIAGYLFGRIQSGTDGNKGG